MNGSNSIASNPGSGTDTDGVPDTQENTATLNDEHQLDAPTTLPEALKMPIGLIVAGLAPILSSGRHFWF